MTGTRTTRSASPYDDFFVTMFLGGFVLFCFGVFHSDFIVLLRRDEDL